MDSIAGKAIKRAKQSLERFTHGEVGDIPRRYIPEADLDRGIRTGKGRSEIRQKYGVAPLNVGPDGVGGDMASGKGRWKYAESLKKGAP